MLNKYDLTENNYGIIRLSNINATHDIGNKGISDNDFEKLFKLCKDRGDVILQVKEILMINIKAFYSKVTQMI